MTMQTDCREGWWGGVWSEGDAVGWEGAGVGRPSVKRV